jgi:hypothetical protein
MACSRVPTVGALGDAGAITEERFSTYWGIILRFGGGAIGIAPAELYS